MNLDKLQEVFKIGLFTVLISISNLVNGQCNSGLEIGTGDGTIATPDTIYIAGNVNDDVDMDLVVLNLGLYTYTPATDSLIWVNSELSTTGMFDIGNANGFYLDKVYQVNRVVRAAPATILSTHYVYIASDAYPPTFNVVESTIFIHTEYVDNNGNVTIFGQDIADENPLLYSDPDEGRISNVGHPFDFILEPGEGTTTIGIGDTLIKLTVIDSLRKSLFDLGCTNLIYNTFGNVQFRIVDTITPKFNPTSVVLTFPDTFKIQDGKCSFLFDLDSIYKLEGLLNAQGNLIVPSDSLFGLYENVGGYTGLKSVQIELKNNTGDSYTVGDNVPSGNYTLNIIATDNSNNVSTTFTASIVILESDILPVSNREPSCVSEVQMTLNTECWVDVTPKNVLSGNGYCYDAIKLSVKGISGTRLYEPGRYEVTATNLLSGISCWSFVNVENKNLVSFDQCTDVPLNVSCDQDLTPGAKILSTAVISGTVFNGNEYFEPQVGDTVRYGFTMPSNPQAYNISISLETDHTNVNELVAELISPTGNKIYLFNEPLQNDVSVNENITCSKKGMDVTFSASASRSYAMFSSYENCRQSRPNSSPSIVGPYKPLGDMTIFDGKNAGGLWVLKVYDTDVNSNLGKVSIPVLSMDTTSSTIGFPFVLDEGTQFVPTDTTNTAWVIKSNNRCRNNLYVTYRDITEDLECNEDPNSFIKKMTRHWTVKDPATGFYKDCIQYFYFRKGLISNIVAPSNFDDIQEVSFISCNDSRLDSLNENGYPHPSVTGYPYDITTPQKKLCKNIQTTYKDDKIPLCGTSYKLIRNWTVLDWCTSEVREMKQFIVVHDKVPPIVTSILDTVTTSTDAYSCLGTYDIPLPIVLYDCSKWDYEVFYKKADKDGKPIDALLSENLEVIKGANGLPILDELSGKKKYRIKNLDIGLTWIQYRITDECGNVANSFLEINTKDLIPPVVICEGNTVSISANGVVYVKAESFDNKSYDNCAVKSYKVRRMLPGCPDNSSLLFSDKIQFCCADIGKTLQVEFQVTDASNNTSSCMTTVNVQDKLPPYMSCPPNITINCTQDYLDLNITGRPKDLQDNCGIPELKYTDSTDLAGCGTGKVYRTWVATDPGGLKTTCIQVITIDYLTKFTQQNIIWPSNRTYNGCSQNTDPKITGEVIFNNQTCGTPVATYQDEKFTFQDSACVKLLRKWTVIDWCQYNDQNPAIGVGYWVKTQVIKIQNTIAPVFEKCETVYIDAFGPCSETVSIPMKANDDCSEESDLSYKYSIDLYNDGAYDVGYTNRQGSTVTGVFPTDTHRVVMTVSDGCGNINRCEKLIIVRDRKKPTPICNANIAAAVMQKSGTVAIWAKDFNLKSEDNCSPASKLRYSFSTNLADSGKVITCADIPNGISGNIELKMYVFDEAGNYDYCTVYFDVQDNEANACEDKATGNALIVSGRIYSESRKTIEGVEVEAQASSTTSVRKSKTSAKGEYSFSNFNEGMNYNISAYKPDNYVTGVTTSDVLAIQKHILGIRFFDSPYKVISADVNKDDEVNISDVTALRKLILGVNDNFDNNDQIQAWRFIPTSTQFADELFPFPVNEMMRTKALTSNISNLDFFGIKLGDVNGTATENGLIVEDRTSLSTLLNTKNQYWSEGDEVNVTLSLDNLESLNAMQGTFNYNSKVLKFKSIESNTLVMTASNYHHVPSKSIIRFSWSTGSVVALKDQLITIKFIALAHGNLSDNLSLKDQELKSEVVGGDYKLYKMGLHIQDVNQAFQLGQNYPNPFQDQTTLELSVPQDDLVYYEIMDASGKKLMSAYRQMKKGVNQIILRKAEISHRTGILYMNVKSKYGKVSKKLISIQ